MYEIFWYNHYFHSAIRTARCFIDRLWRIYFLSMEILIYNFLKFSSTFILLTVKVGNVPSVAKYPLPLMVADFTKRIYFVI